MRTYQFARKRYTPAQRERLLQDYHRSELSQRSFAAQAGIGLTTLQLWLRKAANHAPTSRPRFIELPNPLSSAPASAWAYRVHLAGGVQLEVGSGFEPEELAILLQVLREP
jgi:transposase-like protein